MIISVGIRKKPVETSMYYCKSRYYVSEWGRFLTPDSFEYLDPSSISGVNLYAYCGNDPINYVDPSGCFAIGVTGATTVTITGAQVLGATSVLELTYLFAQTSKRNGYYGERWPGYPHKPDHVHLRGNGIDIRIGRDGNPLDGEKPLNSQAKKALRKLWKEFLELFNKW